MLASGTPFRKVLAVVAQKPVPVLAEPRASPPDDFGRLVAVRCVGSDPHNPAAREACDGDFLDRPPDQGQRPGAIVDDSACAYINAVMEVATSACHQMRAPWWFSVTCQDSIHFPSPAIGTAYWRQDPS